MTTPRPLRPTCHKCGALIDAATAVDGSDVLPYTGAVCICAKCGWVMMFDDSNPPLPRDLKPHEQLEILTDPDVMKTLIAFAIAKRNTIQ